MTGRQQEKSAFLLSLASYVGGIRDGWRRIRGETTKGGGEAKVVRVSERREGGWGGREGGWGGREGGWGEGGGREGTPVGHKPVRGSQSSFEKFLRSLPRVDAVDRTVDWVLAQPDNIEERESSRFANLPRQRLLRVNRRRTLHISNESDPHVIDTHHESQLSVVSWSRYESERGTVGRGTPPVQREDRPRLDLLLQHIHRHQERRAVEQMKQQTNPYSSGDDVMREGVRVCGGGDCRAAVPSQRQLVTHVATSQNNKSGAMIKNKGVGTLPHSHHQHHHSNHHHHHHDSGGYGTIPEPSAHLLLTSNQRSTHITSTTGRRAPNPKMTMVTGLMIRPALVVRKNGGKNTKK